MSAPIKTSIQFDYGKETGRWKSSSCGWPTIDLGVFEFGARDPQDQFLPTLTVSRGDQSALVLPMEEVLLEFAHSCLAPFTTAGGLAAAQGHEGRTLARTQPVTLDDEGHRRVYDQTVDDLCDWLRNITHQIERLRTCPRPNSKWDRSGRVQ